MQIPDYYLKRPEIEEDHAAEFDELYAEAMRNGVGVAGVEINYTLKAPKWQFLCYLCDTMGLLLHGSSNPSIQEFEPRQSNDVLEFGNRKAVYASSDGIWPMFFAIVNRDCVTSLVNGCFRSIDADGRCSEPHYYFSVDEDSLSGRPWRNGTVYVLPRDTFEQQETLTVDGVDLEVPQWASPVAVRPLAKLSISPDDFPFLTSINDHHPQVMSERASRDPNGFPWRD